MSFGMRKAVTLRRRVQGFAKRCSFNLMCTRYIPSVKLQTHYEWKGHPHCSFPVDDRWPNKVRDSFINYNAVDQEAYCKRIPGISVLDGYSGFAASGLSIILESLPYAYAARQPSPLMLYRSVTAVPHGIEYALSLRDVNECSYFHFFNDIIGKYLLTREKLQDGYIRNLIISRDLSLKPWYRSLIRTQLFSGMSWILQDHDETIVCNNLVIAKSPPHYYPYIKSIVAHGHRLVSGRHSTFGDRIFLIRRKDVQNRRIPSNQQVLQERLEQKGFMVLDPAVLSWEDQVLALRECRLLVGIHGGGMTNIMFRGSQPLHVIEVFPPSNIPPHFYWLSYILGYKYTPIVAPIDFEVDIDQVMYAVNSC